jgi:hypothetical protein
MIPKPPIPPGREPSPRFREPTRSPTSDLSTGKAISTRTLTELARARITEDDLREFGKEVKGSSDRTTCIVLSAMIERTLEESILTYLKITDDDLKKLLFESDWALSTFYGNIGLGYAIKLYPKYIMKQFDIIRRIRNTFAHTEIPVTFETEEIKRELSRIPIVMYKSWTDVLIKFRKNTSHERKLFISCCFVLYQILLTQTSIIAREREITDKALSDHYDDMFKDFRAKPIARKTRTTKSSSAS